MIVSTRALSITVLLLTTILSISPTTTKATEPSHITPSIRNFHQKAQHGEPLTVAFLGGSLTWGANASDPNTTSFRGRMMEWLRKTYPKTPFTFVDAAIGGTGSQLAMFRLERDVLAHKPDLVFLDFTINDNAKKKDEESLASYESLIRRLLQHDTMVMPVLTMVKAQSDPTETELPPRHQAHLQLAEAYQLPAANIIPYVRSRVSAGATSDELWPFEVTHPDDSGYQLYFEALRNRFLEATKEEKTSIIPETTVFPNLYPKVTRTRLASLSLPKGWKVAPTYRTSLWYDGLSSRWMDEVAVASSKEPSAPLEIEFEGSMVGLFGERNGYSPDIRVWIDGKPIAPKNRKDADNLWSINTNRISPAKEGTGNLFLWLPLAKDLEDGKHTLRIEPVWDGAHENAELRIESVCSSGR